MKLNFGKRLVLFLHWLFALAGTAIAVVYCVAPNLMWNTFELVYNKIGKRQTDIIGAACLAVYVILAIATVMIIFSNREKKEEKAFIVVDSGEGGRTRVAISAVEQMIRQSVRGIDEINTMRTAIRNMEDSVSIDVDVTIAESSHIPTVTTNIQHAIRSYIELNCGVTVREISVSVRALEQPSEKKHRGKKIENSAPAFTPAPVKSEPVTPVEPAPVQPAAYDMGSAQDDVEEPPKEIILEMGYEPDGQNSDDEGTSSEISDD